MKDCPNCHFQLDEKATVCPNCAHYLGPAQEALVRLEQQLASSVQEFAELTKVLPRQQAIVHIENIIKGSLNDVGDRAYGERGSRLLTFAEIRAGTESAFANMESEKRAHGDTLRMEDMSELLGETHRQWRKVFESKLEQLESEWRQRAAKQVADVERAAQAADRTRAALEVAHQERAAGRALEEGLTVREAVDRAAREAAELAVRRLAELDRVARGRVTAGFERAAREATARARWPSNTQAAKTFSNIKAAIAEIRTNKAANATTGKTGGGT